MRPPSQVHGTAFDGNATGILGQAFSLVDYFADGSYFDDPPHPVHVAVAFPFESDDNEELNGIAVVYDGQTPDINGQAVVRWNVGEVTGNEGGTYGAIAHEVGHTCGLTHDPSTFPGNTSYHSFMRDGTEGGGSAPVLDWDQDAAPSVDPLTQGEVWQDLAPGKWVPRPSGFAHQGCNGDDMFCQNGHPGLECSANDMCEPAP